MKMIIKLLLILSAFIFAGCQTTRGLSIEERELYVNNHPKLDKNIKLALNYGCLELGMTKEEVLAVEGEPLKIIAKKNKKYDEVWIYRPHWKFTDYLYFKGNVLVDSHPYSLIYSKRKAINSKWPGAF